MTKWDERWSKIKKIGSGGQGDVYLVNKLGDVPSQNEIEKLLNSGVCNLATNVYTTGQKQQAIEDLIAAIRGIQCQQQPDELYALKTLRTPDKSRDAELASSRIRNEMKAIGEVSELHPAILSIVDQDVEDMWFVTPYYSRGTLADRQSWFKGKAADALDSILPIVEAVAEIHKKGLVHRDIKPENVFFSADSRSVLGDFGLVFFSDREHTRFSATLENVGSWHWMPMWAQGRRIETISPAFDVFCLGKILWWMVSGQPIERLTAWYCDDEQYEDISLTKLFPGDRDVSVLMDVLSKCVVEREDECLKNATELLKVIADAQDNTRVRRRAFPNSTHYSSEVKKQLSAYKAASPAITDSAIARDAWRAEVETYIQYAPGLGEKHAKKFFNDLTGLKADVFVGRAPALLQGLIKVIDSTSEQSVE